MRERNKESKRRNDGALQTDGHSKTGDNLNTDDGGGDGKASLFI